MKICFGLNLDGQRGWQPVNQLGEITVGPMGMLNILETQLGLLRDYPSQSERIIQYRNCLEYYDNDDRFYHQSFTTDQLGTATTLLAWRDLWYLHGWSGKLDAAASRISDLAAVEQLAVDAVSLCVGQRLKNVLELMRTRRPSMSQVVLTDALADFPLRWQEVLAKLPIKIQSSIAPSGAGLLGELQGSLLHMQQGKSCEKLKWKNDGSLTIVQAETGFMAAHWLAQQLKKKQSDRLIVTGYQSSLLDEILFKNDLSRQGFADVNAFRPSLQVLPLALSLLWKPLDVYALLQFLTHSVCPVPGYARQKLAAVVAGEPGIGGPGWNDALDKIVGHYGDSADKVLETITRWVESPRFAREVGVPTQILLEHVRALESFFRLRLGDDDLVRSQAFYAGFNQSQVCAEALERLIEQQVETISHQQLQKLINQATARGSENPLWMTEVGAFANVDQLGAVLASFEQVVWWQPIMPVMPSTYPWSNTEIGQLEQAGVRMPAVSDQLDKMAYDWLKPIMAAEKNLTLVLPPKGNEVHPVWLSIEALFDELPVDSLESLFTDAKASKTLTAPLPHQPLPEKNRWWKVGKTQSLVRRGPDSYSSLELFLFNPYQWVLRYPAALKASQILSVSDDFLLFGNLAHGLVEHFFQVPNALKLDEKEFSAWFEPAFNQIISEQGATLLMTGRMAELENFRGKLKRSIVQLLSHIKQTSIKLIESELELAGQHKGGDLKGYADLVLTNSKGKKAIVDMKWSGKKYAELLKNNQHLQLAIYGELIRQKTGAWPNLAFYILDRGLLQVADDKFFTDASVINSKNSEGAPELWQQFTKSWAWRRKQLNAGEIEVVFDEIEATDQSTPPEDGLEMKTLNPAYNEFVNLAGWEE